MMFKVRVIPCLDVKDGRVVKGVNFVDLARRRRSGRGGDRLRRGRRRRTHFPRHHRQSRKSRHHARRGATHRRGVLHAAHGGRRRAHDRRYPRAACLQAPTRCRSTPQPSRAAASSKRRRKNSAISASWSRSTPRRCRSRRRPTAGRSSPMAAAIRPGSMPSPTRARWSRSAPAKSCSRRWIATARGRVSIFALTRAIADAVSGAGHRLGRRRHSRSSGRRHSRRPCQRRAGRVDFPFRRVFRARRQESTWRMPACRCGSIPDFLNSSASFSPKRARVRAGRCPRTIRHRRVVKLGAPNIPSCCASAVSRSQLVLDGVAVRGRNRGIGIDLQA